MHCFSLFSHALYFDYRFWRPVGKCFHNFTLSSSSSHPSHKTPSVKADMDDKEIANGVYNNTMSRDEDVEKTR